MFKPTGNRGVRNNQTFRSFGHGRKQKHPQESHDTRRAYKIKHRNFASLKRAHTFHSQEDKLRFRMTTFLLSEKLRDKAGHVLETIKG